MGPRQEMVQHRDEKRRRLASARLGLSGDVVARQSVRENHALNRRTFLELKIFQQGAKDARIQREVLEEDVAFLFANGRRNFPFADRTDFAILRLAGKFFIVNFRRVNGFRCFFRFSDFRCFHRFGGSSRFFRFYRFRRFHGFWRFHRFGGFYDFNRFRRFRDGYFNRFRKYLRLNMFCFLRLGGLFRLLLRFALDRRRNRRRAADFLQPRQKFRYES